jgi:hypothetical protein
MAFTEKARASNVATMANGVSTTLTLSLVSGATPTAPVAGDWLFVAVYSNRGATGIEWQFASPYSVKCGTVTLQLIEAPSANGTGAFLFAAPYQSGMTSSVTIPVTNSSFSTITVGACALVFSGAATAASPIAANYAYRQTTGAGLFDGGGTNTFGSTATAGSAGVITWANSTALPTNYDSQDEPWIAAVVDTSVPTSATLQLFRSAGASGVIADSSGNLYQSGGTPGTLPISTTTGVYNPAGATAYGVIYGTNGNFTFSYTGVSGSNLTGCQTTAPYLKATGSAYCPIMLAGTSGVTITAILNTTSTTAGAAGGLITGNGTYTSGTATAYGHVQVGMGGTGTTPARLNLMGGSNANNLLTQTAYGVQRINGSTTTLGGGQIYTMVPATRTLTRKSSASQVIAARASRIVNIVRQASATAVRAARASRIVSLIRTARATHIQSAKAAKTVNLIRTIKATQASAAKALKAKTTPRSSTATGTWAANVAKTVNLIRAARATQTRAARANKIVNLLRSAKSTTIAAAKALKSRTFNRRATSTQIVAATITRRITFNRRATATTTYAIGSTKSRTIVRRAIATTIGAARALKNVIVKTHPGTVQGGWITSTVQGAWATSAVEGGVIAPTVVGSWEAPSVQEAFATASVRGAVKPLTKE